MDSKMTEQDIEKTEEEDFGIEEIDLYQTYKKPKKAEEPKQEEDEPVNIWREIGSFVGPFVLAFLVAFFLKEYIIINADIPSGSMENTIMTGDRLIGNRLAYLFGEPERGDIIIFKYPDDETQLFVKRIIGMPGETVTIEDAKVYVGTDETKTLLEEPYLKEEWVVGTGPYAFEIPDGSYLVMGDNRNDSKDARYWVNTYVDANKIKGKAVFIYWPFADFGAVK